MVKIIFEIQEEALEQIADPGIACKELAGDGENFSSVFLKLMSAMLLQLDMKKGVTEFIVNPDKLSDKAKDMYDNSLGQVLSMAHIAHFEQCKASGTPEQPEV